MGRGRGRLEDDDGSFWQRRRQLLKMRVAASTMDRRRRPLEDDVNGFSSLEDDRRCEGLEDDGRLPVLGT
ncbi:unnamed protein product [Linum trigynum]|uniref:Uncharacterized protein n=1 Tax=Linum trigynum TaxID=586398 RepID=A0AAV2DCL3_9ROSI